MVHLKVRVTGLFWRPRRWSEYDRQVIKAYHDAEEGCLLMAWMETVCWHLVYSRIHVQGHSHWGIEILVMVGERLVAFAA